MAVPSRAGEAPNGPALRWQLQRQSLRNVGPYAGVRGAVGLDQINAQVGTSTRQRKTLETGHCCDTSFWPFRERLLGSTRDQRQREVGHLKYVWALKEQTWERQSVNASGERSLL